MLHDETGDLTAYCSCDRCRLLKVRCSGTAPCARCERKKASCVFAVEEKRISIPESYLRALQGRTTNVPISQPSRSQEASSAGKSHSDLPYTDSALLGTSTRAASSGQESIVVNRESTSDVETPQQAGVPISYDKERVSTLARGDSQESESPSAVIAPSNEGVGPAFLQNPLVDNDYTFAQVGGRFWYMGPSSSWSFCRRVLALIGKRVPEASHVPDPWHLDGGVFGMQWKPLGHDEDPDVTNLPPLDYALFMFNTVKFYLGTVFYLVDEASYLRNLHELYQDAPAKAKSCRLWYAQYLLFLAFGKAFTVNGSCTDGPAGHQYALRAMSLLPDLSALNVDRMLSIQALTLAAVYLQSIDMRISAYQHIGQALRICVVEGMHRHMPEEVVGADYSRRCNITFWIVYMLDREFSALLGAPNSIRDEDITARLPSHANDSLDAQNMTLHVRLSRLMARILTTVYGVGKEFDGTLVPNTQSILRELAQVSKDLTALLNSHFQGSFSRASRMAQRLILSYHHCVVLTTRPLVMCTLHMHIEETDRQNAGTISLTAPVASLIQSCVDSAQTVLRTLRVLGDEDLLEAFLPFQLEDAFSSAFILSLIRVIIPSLLPDDTWRENIHCILDKMISKGSIVAPLRKRELMQLEDTMTSITPGPQYCFTPLLTGVDRVEMGLSEGLHHEATWDPFGAAEMVGLLPQELLDLADQLDVDMERLETAQASQF
ncbi:fungal-specific transcription factor domain-containing protein [Thozetella sp. PMI_491]|nr:fungal-specific transcription factor domain-containing protein [Thozetella sp. PMI_491]